MTLTLPPWLPEPVMTCVAGHFPTGDESAMRRCADAWADTADQCRPMAERHTAAAHTIRAAGLGHTVDQFAQQHTELADTWRDQATYCDSMAKQLYEGANSIEFQKLVCIFTAGVLAAQLIRDGIAFAAGGGLLAIADRMAAETALGILRKKVLMWLAGAGVKAAAERGLLVLARNAVIIGMAQGGLVNLAAQGVQIMQGHRDDIDPASAAVAIIAGGAGGAAGAVVGHAVAPVPAMFGRTAARTFDRLAPHLGSNITAGLRQAAATRAARLFAHLGGTVFVGGAGGVAGGMAGAVVSLAATGQAFTRQAFTEGIIPGFAGGFLGAAGAALRHAPGSMPAGVPGTPRPESGAPARVRWVDRGLARTSQPSIDEIRHRWFSPLRPEHPPGPRSPLSPVRAITGHPAPRSTHRILRLYRAGSGSRRRSPKSCRRRARVCPNETPAPNPARRGARIRSITTPPCLRTKSTCAGSPSARWPPIPRCRPTPADPNQPRPRRISSPRVLVPTACHVTISSMHPDRAAQFPVAPNSPRPFPRVPSAHRVHLRTNRFRQASWPARSRTLS